MPWSEAELPQGAGAKRNSRREQEKNETHETKWREASYASGVLREGASPRSEKERDDGSSPFAPIFFKLKFIILCNFGILLKFRRIFSDFFLYPAFLHLRVNPKNQIRIGFNCF